MTESTTPSIKKTFIDRALHSETLEELNLYEIEEGKYAIMPNELDAMASIDDMLPSKTIILGEYMHFKGGLYTVIGIAKSLADNSEFVVYENSNGEAWARPYDMFNDEVEHEGKVVKRFEYLEE